MATQRAGSRTRKKQYVKKGEKLIWGPGYELSKDQEKTLGGQTFDRARLDGQRVYDVKRRAGNYEGKGPALNMGSYIADYAEYENVLKPDASELKSKATDQKNPAENIGERQQAASRKKRGRGSLRISYKGNGGASASRLRQGVGGARKRSSGAQGGGRSGLNIPR